MVSWKEPYKVTERLLIHTIGIASYDFTQFLILKSDIDLKQPLIENFYGPNSFINTIIRSYV